MSTLKKGDLVMTEHGLAIFRKFTHLIGYRCYVLTLGTTIACEFALLLLNTHKNQLETGTYCVFATADECKAAFERAKELGFDFLGEHYNNEFIFVCSEDTTLFTYWEESGLVREGKKKIPTTEFLARMEGTWEQPIEQLTLPQAKTYTQDEVIDLLTAERTRAKDIAYEFYKKYKQEFYNYKSAGNKLAFVKEEKAEVARYIGNAISGRNGLTPEKGTIRDRIKQQLNNAKPE